jgi:hypothetical protein
MPVRMEVVSERGVEMEDTRGDSMAEFEQLVNDMEEDKGATLE